MMKQVLCSLALLCCFALGMNAQTIEVTGTVVSATDGDPMIGATVMEAGTSNGTITDFDGNFHLTVSSNSMIQVSFVGYTTQTLKAQSVMDIKLEEDNVLNEVVVVGYQVVRKADLTGAVSVMDMKGPISEADPNMLNSMQGKLAGVDIVTDAAPGGGGATIRVRGMSTVNACDPLLVVDGVATTENLNSINAADIESIQVLKDASSASIYGSRAANGVIIITTKKGKGGKMSVNVNYNTSLQTVAKTFDVMNAEQWGRAYWQACKNDGTTPDSRLYGTGATPQLIASINGINTADTNWQDAVYQSAWTQNLSASVSNSTDKGSFLFSGNYIDQNGLIQQSYYRRFTARVNSVYNISKYVHVGENLMIAKWNDRGASTGNDRGIPYSAMRQHPALPVQLEDGTYASAMKVLASDVANPAHELYNARDNKNDSWRIFGNAFIEVFPVDGLTLKSNLGIEHIQFFNKNLGRVIEDGGVSEMSRAFGSGDTWTWTNTANYYVSFGQHSITALAGVEAIKYVFEDLSGWRNQFAFEDQNFMQLGAGTGNQTNGGGKSEWALFSLFGKVDYNFADRYLLSATLRRDATSRLDKSSNSGIFPAFSGAWRVSEEAFWTKNDIVDDVKVRVGWGQNGNSAINNLYAGYSTYRYTAGNGSYDLYGSNTDEVSGVIVASSGNKNLKWETTTQTNIGVDMALLNRQFTLSLDYYWKKTTDMLTIPPTLSVAGENAAVFMNTGTMNNRGFELNLNYRSKQYGDFSWEGNVNWSMYRNKLVKFNDKVHYEGGDFRLIEGQPMGVYYGWVCDGIFQNAEQVANHAEQPGKAPGRLIYRDINGDGKVDDNDRCIIGNPNPDFNLGINLSASYKNFTLSAFFAGEFGFDVYNTTKRQLYSMSYGNLYSNHSVDVLNAWTPENTGASIPALSMNDNNSETRMSTYLVEDGSYMKCKYIKFGYNFDQKWMQTIGLSALNIFAQMENVFTITSFSGLDPEVPRGGYGARIDNGPYPRAHTFSLGINATF